MTVVKRHIQYFGLPQGDILLLINAINLKVSKY